MIKYYYVCSVCHHVSNEDFWDCPKCNEDSKIYQSVIREYNESIVIGFHSDVKYSDAELSANAIAKKFYPEYKLKHSKHSATLSGLSLEFVFNLI